MPELISIPISTIEIVIEYVRPNMRFLMDRVDTVEALFEALKPWNVTVDDVEIVSDGKPSERGVKLRLPIVHASFFFGASSCRFTRDDIDWGATEDTVALLDLILKTVAGSSPVGFGDIRTAVALHLQPKVLSYVDILKPLVPSTLSALDPSALQAFATVAKWEDRTVTIDGSSRLANGIFLRFERRFAAGTEHKLIAEKLKADEIELFDLLGVKEDQS
jgi:hypothetical protein